MTILHFFFLFFAKVCDNALGTAKMILIQRGRCILSGIAVTLSTFIGYWITKSVVTADNILAIVAVSAASGVGCCLAMLVSDRISKDRTYVNVIMSDNKKEMQKLRDFLAEHHITNVTTDSYTRDWSAKTITVTAYPETKAESNLINSFIEQSSQKFKRVIQKT